MAMPEQSCNGKTSPAMSLPPDLAAVCSNVGRIQIIWLSYMQITFF